MKPGYKQTEVGYIPEDWEVVPISELVTEFRGGATLGPSDFKSTGIKVLPKGAVGRTGWIQVDDNELQYCSPSYASAHRSNEVDESYSIVVLRDLVPSGPSIGLIVQVKEPGTWILAQGVYGFKVNERAVPGFLTQLSNTQWYRRLMNSIMVGSTQVHVTNTAFKAALIPLPSTSEQRAIATALSDVDALLGGLDRLIAKKRDLKQAVMQQLLTGQTRLPGFSGEWGLMPLEHFVTGDRFAIVDGPFGSQLKVDEYVESGVPVIEMEHLSDDFITESIERFITPRKFEDLKRSAVYPGDIIISKTGSLGKLGLIPGRVERGLITSRLAKITLDPSRADQLFVFQCLLKLRSEGYWERVSQGGTMQILGIGMLQNAPIPNIGVAEQAAIAAVFSDMGAELLALEARRDKTRDLKRAMMQELLTGKTRLVPAGAAHA
jgi:type I restriction enzyme S subunit